MVSIKEITSKEEWEAWVLTRPEANFLHSWNWGEFHHQLGHQISRVGFYQDSRLIGVMLSIVEAARRATYLTVPGGPLIDWTDNEVTASFRNEIIKQARRFECAFIRVRPQIWETKENAELFSSWGFRRAPMHLHAELTHQLDITQSEEKLLAEMRKATRYEIKQAQKLEIRITTSQDPADVADFYALQMQTAQRQGFVPFNKIFLEEQFKVFVADDQTVLYTAWLGKTKLAQAMVIFYGQEGDYHYGAGSEAGRKYPGAYLIQWEAIKEAKMRGLERYNLWGVAPEGDKAHRFHGVSVFKRGFGGEDINYLHARDLIIDRPKYIVNYFIEVIRKWTRKV